MRVLMLAWEWPPQFSGGLGVTAAGLARALARRGVSVSVLLPPGVASVAAVRRARFETAGVDLIPAELVGCRVLPSQQASSSYAAIDRGAIAEYARAAQVVSAFESFDLVHAHDWMSFPAAERVAAAQGCPWIAHLHSLESDRTGGQARDASARIEGIEAQGLQSADLVLCVSRGSAVHAQSRHGLAAHRLRVLYGAAAGSERVAHANGSAQRPQVLFLGRFERQKGADLFFEAASRLIASGVEADFRMLGEGALLPSIRASFGALGLDATSICPGKSTQEAGRAALESADLVVMPSRREPFGLVALEAARAGRCVIISERAGVRELLPSAPALDCEDVSQLSKSIAALLAAPAERERLAVQLRAEAGGHGWEERARTLNSIYEELCSR